MAVDERATVTPWLASYPPDVPRTLDYPGVPIGTLLDRIDKRHGHADAVVFQGEVLTWREVRKLSNQLATALHNLNVRKGDRVVLLLPNVPHFVIAYYAILKLGAIVVATNPLFTDRDLESYIRKTDARVVITLDVLYEKIEATWKTAGVEHVVIGNALDLLPRRLRLAAGTLQVLDRAADKAGTIHPYLGLPLRMPLDKLGQTMENVRRMREAPKPKGRIGFGAGIQSFRKILMSARDDDPGVEVSPNDPAVIVYTTGTTGTPKGAVLTHANLVANAYQMRNWFPELKEGKETIMAVLPFFHSYGLTLIMNAGLVLAARSLLIPRVILKDIFEAIQAFRPTALPGVPALFVSIINSDRVKQYDLRSIRVCVSGGAPLPMEVKERFDALTGGHLYEGYGLTEAGPLTHAHPYDQTAPLGSIGLPVADTLAKIVDDEGREVSQGQQGELIVRGPQIMREYWDEPEETASVLRDGWLYTGDIATMDELGFFYIVDRKKDLIITGGENIAPREIEEALYRNPKVEEAAVAGVPHTFGGEIAKAFVILRPGETATASELKKWLGGQLPHYKIPREIEFRSELPKSPMGKILKRKLVEAEPVAAPVSVNRRPKA